MPAKKKPAKKIRKPSALELLQRRVESMDASLVHLVHLRAEMDKRLVDAESIINAQHKDLQELLKTKNQQASYFLSAIGNADRIAKDLRIQIEQLNADGILAKIQSYEQHAYRLEKAGNANSVAIEEAVKAIREVRDTVRGVSAASGRQERIVGEAALTSRIVKLEESSSGRLAALESWRCVAFKEIHELDGIGNRSADLEKKVDILSQERCCLKPTDGKPTTEDRIACLEKLEDITEKDIKKVFGRLDMLERVAKQPVPGDARTLPEWIDTLNFDVLRRLSNMESYLQETRELVDRVAMQPAASQARINLLDGHLSDLRSHIQKLVERFDKIEKIYKRESGAESVSPSVVEARALWASIEKLDRSLRSVVLFCGVETQK